MLLSLTEELSWKDLEQPDWKDQEQRIRKDQDRRTQDLDQNKTDQKKLEVVDWLNQMEWIE